MKKLLSILAVLLMTVAAKADRPSDHNPLCVAFTTLHVVDPAEPNGWCYAVSFECHGVAAKWELWGASVNNVCTQLDRGPVDMGNNGVHTCVIQGGPWDQAGLYLIVRDNVGGATVFYPNNY